MSTAADDVEAIAEETVQEEIEDVVQPSDPSAPSNSNGRNSSSSSSSSAGIEEEDPPISSVAGEEEDDGGEVDPALADLDDDEDDEDDEDFEDGASEDEAENSGDDGDGDGDDKDGNTGGSLLKKRKKSSSNPEQMKRKIQKKDGKRSEKGSKKMKRSKFIEREAEESGDEGGDDDDDGEGDVADDDRDDYEYDGFVVEDGVEGSDEDDDDDEDGLFEKTDEKKKKKKGYRRLQKRTDDVMLEEDDLMLIEENQRAQIEEDADEEEAAGDDDDDEVIAPEAVKKAEGGRRRGFFDQDEDEGSMDGFIIDDGMDAEDDKEGEEGDAEEGDGKPRRVRKPAPSAAVQRRRREGPSTEEIDEVHAMFGEDFDDFDEEEEGLDEAADEGEEEDDEDGRTARRGKKTVIDLDAAEAKMMVQVRSRYNRSELVESFCTDRDDVIRKVDRPERSQDVMVGRAVPDDQERGEEAEWMARKLTDKIIAEISAAPGLSYEEQNRVRSQENQDNLERILKDPIEAVLKFFQVEKFEVPFIWTHRRDYLAPQMTRRHLWHLFALDERWERLYTMKKRISEQLAAVYNAADESASSAEGAYQAEERVREFRRLKLDHDAVQRELQHAEDDLQIAVSVVDTKDEEATAEDREDVEVKQDAVDAATSRLNKIEKKLSDAKDLNVQARRKRILSSKYRPEAAVEVATLFPRHKYQYMIDAASEEQEVRDLMGFLTLLLKGAEAGSVPTEKDREEGADETDREMTESVVTAKTSRPNRVISMGKDEYKRYRRIPRLRDFANMFALSACDFGDAIRHGIDAEPPVAPPTSAEDTAADFVDGHILKTPAAVLKATSVMLASELCAEPSVRAAARAQYRRGATVSTRPTPKGLLAINPFSPLFGIHYLDRKELEDFYKGKDRTLFLRLVEAEKNGLITVRLDPPQERTGVATLRHDLPSDSDAAKTTSEWTFDPKPFLLDSGAGFAKRMLPRSNVNTDVNPAARASWDKLRLSILESLIEKHLVPSLEQEFRRELVRIGKEAVVEEAAENFEAMLAVGPYRAPPTGGGALQAIKDVLKSCPKRPAYYTVVAVVLSQDMRQPACLAYVDAEGTLRAQKPVPDTIWKSHKESTLKEFIFDHRPDVVVVNSSAGQAAIALKQLLVTSVINNVAETIRAQYRDRRVEREERLGGFVPHRDDEEGLTNYNANVIIIKDDVSAIFKISPRAKKLFPEFEQGVAAAICLARFVQEPLAEYCALWTSANAVEVFGYEALFLDVHPLKHLLGNVKLPLLQALEHCLVDAVCQVGVDLHLAVNHDHLSPMLAFVAGLGLRKAEALKMAIRKRLRTGSIACRNELLEKKLVGPVVWTNAASFLRIPEDRLKSTNVEWDPFEDTRIHPECYIKDDFAPKICADSLEVEHDQHKYLDTVVKQMSHSRKRLLRRLQNDEPWVITWQMPRPTFQSTGYGSGVVVPTSVWMRRPVGTYQQTRKAVVDGRETEVQKNAPVELDDAMSLLDLEDYTTDLERQGHGKRLLQLQAIKDELRYPYLDLRRPLEEPDERDMFTIITGENDTTLYVGLKTGCVVTRIIDEYDNRGRKQRAYVRTDSGLRGSISLFEIFDDRVNEETDNITDYLQVGMHTTAVIVNVDKSRISVDLSIKPKYLAQTEDWWLSKRFYSNGHPGDNEKCVLKWWEGTGKDARYLFDPRFNEVAACKAFHDADCASLNRVGVVNELIQHRSEVAAASVVSSAVAAGQAKGPKVAAMKMRTIYHPLFANVSYKEAEERLRREGKGAGEVIFRPSSKGPDFISITWAFQDSWFKHFDMEERGKMPGQLGLATELYVKESEEKYSECFSDLDEVTARYIEPMNDFVGEVLRDSHFRDGLREDVEKDMLDAMRRFPNVAQYRMRFNSKIPGTFTLTWVDCKEAIKTGLITVTPKGFVPSEDKPADLNKGTTSAKRKELGLFKSLSALYEWFKDLQSRTRVPVRPPGPPAVGGGRSAPSAGASASASAGASASSSSYADGQRRSRFEPPGTLSRPPPAPAPAPVPVPRAPVRGPPAYPPAMPMPMPMPMAHPAHAYGAAPHAPTPYQPPQPPPAGWNANAPPLNYPPMRPGMPPGMIPPAPYQPPPPAPYQPPPPSR